MNDDKFLDLAKRIHDKTKLNVLNWVPGSSANSYQTTIGSGAVLIWSNMPDEQYPADYVMPLVGLTFLNDRGENIGSVDCYDSTDSNYEMLCQIFNLAENSYMKIDETIKSMYDDLLQR